MKQLYSIYDKKKSIYLDRNLYYINQYGIIYKLSQPLPIKLQEQERYEIRLIIKGDENGD